MSYIITSIAIILAMGSLFVVKKYYPAYKDDNVIEEFVEDVIKDKASIDVDLTPFSPEDKKES